MDQLTTSVDSALLVRPIDSNKCSEVELHEAWVESIDMDENEEMTLYSEIASLESTMTGRSFTPATAENYQIVQVDTNLANGIGYAIAVLSDLLAGSEYTVVSRSWSNGEGSNDVPVSELKALRHCLEFNAMYHCNLMWTTSNHYVVDLLAMTADQSAHELPNIYDQLTDIQAWINRKRIVLRSKWIPLRLNEFRGQLASLAATKGVREVKQDACVGQPGQAFPMGIFFTMVWSESKRSSIMAEIASNRERSPRAINPEEDEVSSNGSAEPREGNEDEIRNTAVIDEDATSTHSLLLPTSDFHSVQIVQSDASGVRTEGCGYVWSDLASLLTSSGYHWLSRVWQLEEYPYLAHSEAFELIALLHFCEHSIVPGSQVLWITDNVAAVNLVNQQNTHPAALTRNVLQRIFSLAVEKNCRINASWVPRTLNDIADYLSHLSANLSKPQVEGMDDGNANEAFPLALFFHAPTFGPPCPSSTAAASTTAARAPSITATGLSRGSAVFQGVRVQLECTRCNFVAAHPPALAQHMEMKHLSRRKRSCGVCKRYFHCSEDDLLIHQKTCLKVIPSPPEAAAVSRALGEHSAATISASQVAEEQWVVDLAESFVDKILRCKSKTYNVMAVVMKCKRMVDRPGCKSRVIKLLKADPRVELIKTVDAGGALAYFAPRSDTTVPTDVELSGGSDGEDAFDNDGLSHAMQKVVRFAEAEEPPGGSAVETTVGNDIYGSPATREDQVAISQRIVANKSKHVCLVCRRDNGLSAELRDAGYKWTALNQHCRAMHPGVKPSMTWK